MMAVGDLNLNLNLKLLSYNCRGLNDSKKIYLLSLLKACDVLFLQEHWLTDGQIQDLNSVSDDHFAYGVSGFDNKEVLHGRPYGGCAILWRRNLNARISYIDSGSRRVCAVRCSFDFGSLLLINAYMPYEQGDMSSAEFSLQLSTIDYLIQNNAGCHVIIGGDFNVDFGRDWAHTNLLNDFCNEHFLFPVVHHVKNEIDYSYNFGMQRFQLIDHFILSEQFFKEFVSKVNVLHDIDNLSDHDPIALELLLNTAHLSTSRCQFVPKVAWYKAKPEDCCAYAELLRHKLTGIDIPVASVLCHDVFCCDPLHREQLNRYIRDISESCLQAGRVTIPHTAEKRKCRIPGWKEFVEPARDKSLFWHSMWLECGKPKTGVVADVMRKTRASYHYAIRHVRKCEQQIVNDRFAEAIVGNRSRDFWNEVKRMKCSAVQRSGIIDGLSSTQDISDYFMSKYQDLYTSVSYDDSVLCQFRADVNQSLTASGYDGNCIFQFNDIRDAVYKLKSGKNDGNLGLSSDYFVNACDELFIHTALLLSSLTVHGYAPSDMLISTVIPIPKGRNVNVTDSANYRGISLSSIFGKVFDLVLLSRYVNHLCISDYQFGFRPKRSTDMCTMILKECMSYYVNNGGSVYCTFLDASKAFDRVEYCKLFRRLYDRGLPPVIIRLMLNMYVGHVTRVEWNGIRSHTFSVCNGVKQGGIISPILFCVYIDDLLCSAADLGVGCMMGEFFVGILAYADDIVLLAPTANAMRVMLARCDSFAKDCNIIFNANKTKCLYITSRLRSRLGFGPNPEFKINGQPIEYVHQWPHLGHIISSTLDDTSDITQRRNSMAGQINNVLCHFGKLDSLVKLNLMKAYCCSLYGSVLWNLSNPCVESVCCMYRRGLRRVFGLPYNAHSALLSQISGSLPIMDELCKRFLLFSQRCWCSDSDLVRFALSHAVSCGLMNSPLGRNVVFCCLRYHISIDDFLLVSPKHISKHISDVVLTRVDDVTFNMAQLILELMAVRSGVLKFSGDAFSLADICDMIEWCSVS